MIESPELPTTAQPQLPSTSERHATAVELLAVRLPEYAAQIVANERLADALTAAERSTRLSAQQIVDQISNRELASAQRPIDVLASRCMTLICDSAADSGPADLPPATAQSSLGSPPEDPTVPSSSIVTETESSLPVFHVETPDGLVTPSAFEPPPSVAPDHPRAPVQIANHHRTAASQRRRARAAAPIVLPKGADRDRAVWPFAGHRYVSIVGSAGGVGATTVTVLLGQLLATLRTDHVAAMDAAPQSGALAFRSGTESDNSISKLVAAESDIQSYNDLDAHIDRLPSRLGVAKTLATDPAVQADDYRRVVDLMARHFDLLITDIGPASAGETAGAAVGAADLVVLVTNPTEHGLQTTARTLDVLESQGAGSDRVILTVNGVHRRSAVQPGRFTELFGARCAASMWLPWDRHLSVGNAISLPHIHRSTMKAALRLSAAAVQSMSPIEIS
jgi:MinD-like ATPase involved in chromosome partitioning or flagellar assembly